MKLRILTDVSRIDILSDVSAVKLRLERFRTSHARVGVNLLLLQTGARKMRATFVSFLFKTRTHCGDSWKSRKEFTRCTFHGASGTRQCFNPGAILDQKNASHNCAKANQCVVCCRTVAVCADVPLVPENFIVVDTGYLTCGSGKPA
jgi:hypothetical protein